MTIDDEIYYEKLLDIKTTGRDASLVEPDIFPYEPTPYYALEKIANSGYIKKKDYLLDYGCGKGRVDFYLTYQTGCHSIGIEYNNRLVIKANENKRLLAFKAKTEFININAVDYNLDDNINRIYFFNPFSLEILKSVFDNILVSYHRINREILLFFYYPSKKYVDYLDMNSNIELIDKIAFDLSDEREVVLIYKLK